jgi:CRP-like cAMP-binding protein
VEDNATTARQILDELLRDARTKRIPAGQIIAYEGDTPHEVFILANGAVQIYDIDDQGNEKILHIVKPRALIPFAFFSGLRRPLRWYYSAISDCELFVFPLDELKSKTRSDGTLAEILTNNFSDDVHELLVRLSSLGKTTVTDKVIAALRFLAVHHSTRQGSGWWQVDFPVSHQLIANLCGTTRESAALVMKDLQTQGLVNYPKATVLEISNTLVLQP